MGIVTDTLIQILTAQIANADRGTVVWYDPTQDYAAVQAALTADQLGAEAIFRYDPQVGFFALRHSLESIWHSIDLNAAPKLLIYVPLAQAETANALIEYEVGGAVMQPGQQPPERNTALSAVTRLALQTVFPQARLEEIVQDVAAGKLSLAELDQLAERGSEAQTGALSVIFGTGNVTEVVLAFLSNADADAKIAEKHAESDIATLLSETLGVELKHLQTTAALRARASRQILGTDFIYSITSETETDLPNSLKTFPLAQSPIARQAVIDLAHQWRNRRDIAPSYVIAANRIQTELGIGSLEISLDSLARSETFLAAELSLQTLVEEALIKRPVAALIDLAHHHIKGFWSSQQPECKTRWEVIFNAGRVLQEASRIENALKGKQWSASKLFAQYAYGEAAWCNLDTVQRHLERDIHQYSLNLQKDSLQRLIALASQRYAATLNGLAEKFILAYRDEQFELADVQLQTDIYRDFVAPRALDKRVAYILVDAFRFEMAREFHAVIQATEPGWQSDLSPALATPPTITDIGMAALMPGAENGLILKADKGALIPFIADKAIRNPKARFERLRAALGQDVLELTLDDIAPLRKAKVIKDLEKARFAVITASDDIDGLGENMPQKAWRSIDEVLNLLRRGLSALFEKGFREVVITADHGFILADRLDDSQKIEAPEGQQVILKRRVWVGRGGASHDAVIRVPLSDFGIGGDLELVTPIGLAVFKVPGGNTEYFHGGLALQEIVIPVLVISSTSIPSQATGSQLRWKLTLGSHKITSPYVSVTIEASSSELFAIELPSVRVEIRDHNQTLSVPVSASYGFQEATKDVKLAFGTSAPDIEKNTVMVYLSEQPESHTVTVHLLDATTGLSLKQIENVEIDLSLFN